ncbi:MAG: PhzF family phenazine biosynthesis protein [Polyangiaceae bacterium]
MRTFRYVLCDVFTDRPLEGNPLAVFTDARGLDTPTMQALAREMNLSESVFVLPAEASGDARIRIFTPKIEVAFAGHPTLGTAFVLGQPLERMTIALETGAGTIPVSLEREGDRVAFGWMRQPIPSVVPYPHAAELCAALGVGRAHAPVDTYDNGVRHVLVMLENRAAVSALRPDFAKLAGLAGIQTISAFAGSGEQWKTRVFAPAAGVTEDPATGSAAGPLAVHLARHGFVAFGQRIRIDQGAEIQRPSVLSARAHGTAQCIEGVEVGGAAVVVARGEFRLP